MNFTIEDLESGNKYCTRERLRSSWPFRGEPHCQDRRWSAVLPAAIKCKVRAVPQGLQHVPRSLGHGRHTRRHGCAVR